MTVGITFRWPMYFLHFSTDTVTQNSFTPMISSCFVLGFTSHRMYSFSSCHIFSMELQSRDSVRVGHQLIPVLAYYLWAVPHMIVPKMINASCMWLITLYTSFRMYCVILPVMHNSVMYNSGMVGLLFSVQLPKRMELCTLHSICCIIGVWVHAAHHEGVIPLAL